MISSSHMYEEISGHPTTPIVHDDDSTTMITICANCDRLKSVLFLTGDRWICTACKNEGVANYTQIPISNPRRK